MIDQLLTQEIQVEWPGWPLTSNPFGDEFDADARRRMVIGGRRIVPFLQKHHQFLDGNILEMGPFFNPMMGSEEMVPYETENTRTFYLENDPHVIDWLKEKTGNEIIDLDINKDAFDEQLHAALKKEGEEEIRFNAIIISQLINYIDFRALLRYLRGILNDGGAIFINNVVDYGLPALFSEGRPRSNDEVLQAALALGYKVSDQKELPMLFDREKYPRYILVLTK